MKKTAQEQEEEYQRLYQFLSRLSSKASSVSFASLLDGTAEASVCSDAPPSASVSSDASSTVPSDVPSTAPLETPKPKKRPMLKRPPPPTWKEGSVLSFFFPSTTSSCSSAASPSRPTLSQGEMDKLHAQGSAKEKIVQGAGDRSTPRRKKSGMPESFEPGIQTHEPSTQIANTSNVPSSTVQTSHSPTEERPDAQGAPSRRYRHTRKKEKEVPTKRGRPKAAPLNVFTLDVPPARCEACYHTFASHPLYEAHRKSSLPCQRWLALGSRNAMPSLPISLWVEECMERATTGSHPHQCRFCEERFTHGAQHRMHFYESRVCNRLAHDEFIAHLNK